MPTGDRNKFEDNILNQNSKGPWGNLGSKQPQKPTNINGGAPAGSGGNRGGMGGGNGGDEKVFDIDKFFRSGGGNDFNISAKLLVVIALIVVFGWAITGFYKVDASEEGIVLRFGKYNRTTNEGLRYKLPSPIEEVYIVKKTSINSIEIGYKGGVNEGMSRFAKNVSNYSSGGGQEILMITGDTNIASVSFVVQWRIKNSFDFLFEVQDDQGIEDTIRDVAESAMREVVGRLNFAEAMTTARGRIENDVQKIIQDVLDSYKAGIEVYAVNLNDVQNPSLVMPAFLDVETAKQDKETAINKSKSFENDIIPKARGEAQQMIAEAEAYKQKVTSVADGEAQRFISVYNEYKNAKDVTKQRLYLETMQQILTGANKTVIDKNVGGGVVPYLQVDKLEKNRK